MIDERLDFMNRAMQKPKQHCKCCAQYPEIDRSALNVTRQRRHTQRQNHKNREQGKSSEIAPLKEPQKISEPREHDWNRNEHEKHNAKNALTTIRTDKGLRKEQKREQPAVAQRTFIVIFPPTVTIPGPDHVA